MNFKVDECMMKLELPFGESVELFGAHAMTSLGRMSI
jgi:hypothetical protein